MDTINIQGKTFVLTPIDEYMDEMLGRQDIMEYLECSNVTLFRKPWVFPDFGVAVKGKRGIKPYKRRDVLDWLAVPENKRKKLYKEYKEKENGTNKQN